MADVQAAAGSLTACPAASLLTAVALKLLNDTLVAEREAALARGRWSAPQPLHDVVVVGGGAAGSALAARLSEDRNLTVLLLEAGGEEPATLASYGLWYAFSHETAMDWGYHSAEGQWLESGRGLGGSSSINGMQYVRALPQDLDGWAERDGLRGWAYRDVLPYFKRAEGNLDLARTDAHLEEDKHGREGPLPVSHFPRRDPLAGVLLKALADLGLNYTDAVAARPAPGVSLFQSTARHAQRVSANQAYLEPARGRPNLDVLTHVHATRVLLDDNNKATGVEYRAPDGSLRCAYARREVVLSAGAIRSPQLLMLSGVGPAGHLREQGVPVRLDLPVGDNFQDMPVVVPAMLFRLPVSLQQPAELQRMLADMAARPHAGQFAADTPRRVMALFDTADPLRSGLPNVQLRFSGRLSERAPAGCPPARGIDNLYYDMLEVHPILMGGTSRGKVRLNGTDPLAAPVVHDDPLGTEADVEAMVAAMRWAAKLADTPTFRAMGVTLDREGDPACAPKEGFGTDSYWRCVARRSAYSTAHYAGSCAMGAVLDERMRVRGAHGLRVVDASAMPRLPRASTYATTLMLAEKAADMIKEDLQSHSGRAL